MRTSGKAGLVALVAAVTLLGAVQAGVVSPALSQQDGSNADLEFREVGDDVGLEYSASSDWKTRFGNTRVGVYTTDFDGDGRTDLLAVGGDRPVLYRNTGGAYERADALPEVGITVKSALFFDHDNDGLDDLLLLPVNGTPRFLENVDGTFRVRDVGFDEPVAIGAAATTLDYDRDGCLDVFIAQNGDWRNGFPARGRGDERGPEAPDNGNPNYLYSGACGSFERVDDAGIEGTRWSVATSAVDLNGDGWTDLHVANDYNTDVVYLNRQDGTFERTTLPATDRHGMASEVADVDGDGDMDLFVTNIHYEDPVFETSMSPNFNNEGNSLLLNRGNGTFNSSEHAYGVADGGWGWAAVIVDFDNDGDRDLAHTTKFYTAAKDVGDGMIRDGLVETRPRVWTNGEGGFQARDAGRLGFERSNGRGLVHLDYDGDGDQDLVVADSNSSSRFKLYENEVTGEGNWVQIRLDPDGDRPVIGSTVCVEADERRQCEAANAKADFLSQDTRTHHFGVGGASTVTVEVTWPDGTVSTYESVSAGQRVTLRPGTSDVATGRE
jgi:hypothetical protein